MTVHATASSFFNQSDTMKISNIDHVYSPLQLGAPDPRPTNCPWILRNTSVHDRLEDYCNNQSEYYQTLKITVNTAGNDTFRSNSSRDTFRYLYINTFDPTFSGLTMLHYNDDDARAQQSLLPVLLQTMTDYILVATPFFSDAHQSIFHDCTRSSGGQHAVDKCHKSVLTCYSGMGAADESTQIRMCEIHAALFFPSHIASLEPPLTRFGLFY